jgi:hypothetical protein
MKRYGSVIGGYLSGVKTSVQDDNELARHYRISAMVLRTSDLAIAKTRKKKEC